MLLRCLLTASCLILSQFANADSLYDANDPILELDVDTFNGAVYNSEKAHFVEFYSSWCGACIAYAPTFKEFARDLALWKPFVQVTAVNCADDKNMPLCREHSVNSFPTMKYFKRGAANKDDVEVYAGNKYDLWHLEHDVAAYVKSDMEKNGHPLSEVFVPIESSKSLDDIWSSSASVNLVGVAVEEEPASMSWALMLNFYKDRNIRVVMIRPDHPLAVKHLAPDSKSGFMIFKRGELPPLWTHSTAVKWTVIKDKIDEYVTSFAGNVAAPDKQLAVEPQAPAPVANVDMTQYQVQLVDLKSTLSYMLFKEIPRRTVISGDDLVALKQWMRTLSKYAPGTTPIRRLLYRMNEWIWTVGDSLATDDWTKKLEEIQLALGNPLPRKVEWIACNGSKPNLRGYTCGLWTTAHAISVAAYKAEENNPSFNPVNEVMEPFHQFIFRYLSCGECAKNFDKEAKKHKLLEVATAHDMVMWFWRVHNSVNARLSGARSDDPKFPKRQFPPSVVCGQCYDSNGSFDEKEIFKFMLAYYSDIRQDSVQAPPEYKMNVYKDGKLQAVGSRHLNPKFAVHADKVGKLEEVEERLRKELDANPQREWKDIEGYDNLASTGRSHFYLVWLTMIAFVIILAYCKYRRNRSKFWKTFYYHNDFKLFNWSSETGEKKYTA